MKFKGGEVLSTNNQSPLQFSVKESVWFEKGQEVADFLSISLEPDIVIHENEHYISIRGALELSGEYYPDEQIVAEHENESLRENTSVRIIDDVRQTDNGTNELKHEFPVDITIPMNRVENLDDVYVMVESFDYETPEKGCLQLIAELSISGIKGTVNEEESERMDREEESNRQDESVFSFSNDEEELIDQQLSIADEEENKDENQMNLESSNEFPSFEIEERKDPEMRLNFSDDHKVDDEIQDEIEDREKEEDPEEQSSPQVEMKGREENTNWTPQENSSIMKEKEVTSENQQLKKQKSVQYEEEVQEEQDNGELTPNYSKKDENALYLTGILKNEGEQFSKLRMRIIQRGESLDTIANDYNISMNKIMQLNKLEDDIVEEGEIIYIPANAGESQQVRKE